VKKIFREGKERGDRRQMYLFLDIPLKINWLEVERWRGEGIEEMKK